jgi:hypothetical protein
VAESIMAENQYFMYEDPHDFIQSHKGKRDYVRVGENGYVSKRGRYTYYESPTGVDWNDINFDDDDTLPEIPENQDFRRGPTVSPQESRSSTSEVSLSPETVTTLVSLLSELSQSLQARVPRESPERKSPRRSSPSPVSTGTDTRRRARGRQQGLSLSRLAEQQQNVRRDQSKAKAKSTSGRGNSTQTS